MHKSRRHLVNPLQVLKTSSPLRQDLFKAITKCKKALDTSWKEKDSRETTTLGFGKKKDSKDGKASGSGGSIKTPNTGKQPGAEGEGGVQPVTTIEMDKTKRIQGQLDEVTGIMNQNIDSAQKRGADLDQMQDQMADLEQGANQFNKNSAQVKKNLWYKNMKMTIMITIIVLVIIAVIVAVIIMQSKDK